MVQDDIRVADLCNRSIKSLVVLCQLEDVVEVTTRVYSVEDREYIQVVTWTLDPTLAESAYIA